MVAQTVMVCRLAFTIQVVAAATTFADLRKNSVFWMDVESLSGIEAFSVTTNQVVNLKFINSSGHHSAMDLSQTYLTIPKSKQIRFGVNHSVCSWLRWPKAGPRPLWSRVANPLVTALSPQSRYPQYLA